MSADTTPGAVFVSDDGKVSFDEKGYRLDSLGNRTYNNSGIWGESKPRYSKPVQDAIDAYNAEVARYEAQRDAFLAQIQAQPGMWSTPAAASTWRPSTAPPTPTDYTTQLDQLRARSAWRPPEQPAPLAPQSPGPGTAPPAADYTSQLDQLRARSAWRPTMPEQMPPTTSPNSPYTPLELYNPLARYNR